MSDRFPQYPMLSNFNNPALLQNQQQPPQHQQHPQQQQQQDPAASYTPDSRLWQMQQLRPRSGMDITQPSQPSNSQMAEYLRVRMNASNPQMGQQPPSQPQFSVGMSPQHMAAAAGGMNALPPNQQQSFHDANSNQSQPSHMPSAGFPTMGPTPLPNQTPGLSAASLRQPPNASLLGMQNSGAMGRQLELMLAQQPQNGVMFGAPKMNQQPAPQAQQQQQRDQSQQPQQNQPLQPPGMNHPNPADIFTSPAMSNDMLRRPSPSSHPPNLNPQMQPNLSGGQQPPPPPPGMIHPGAQGMNPNRRPGMLSAPEIQERIKAARQSMLTADNDLRNFMNQIQVQSSTPEATMKLRAMHMDLQAKKENLNKLQQLAFSNGGLNPNLMPNLRPNNAPGQHWTGQPGQPPVFDNNGAGMPRPNHPQNSSQPQHPQSIQQPPNGLQSSPSLMQSQATNHLMNSGPNANPQGIQPPQQLGSPFPGQMNVSAAGPTNMANKPAFPLNGFMGNPSMSAATAAAMQQQRSMNGGPAGALGGLGFPPPIEKAKFDSAFGAFVQKRNMKLDRPLLRLNDQPIDLARLHALVMNEGGFQKVNENESWHIIGGRLGFVQFPGSDREPAKSGPGVAQHLAHVYRLYLCDFEQTYVRTWIQNNSMRLVAAANMANNFNMQQNGMKPPGAAGPGVDGPQGGTGGNVPNGPAGPNGLRFTPQLLQYAHLSTAELHQRGVPEQIIAMVEQHRPQLQRTIMENKRFQQQIRINMQNPSGAGPRMGGLPVDVPTGMQPPNQAGGAGGMLGDPSQANGAAAAAMMRQQQMLQQHKQQQEQQQQQQLPQQGGSQTQPMNLMEARHMSMQQQSDRLAPNVTMFMRPEQTRAAIEMVNRLKDDFKKGPTAGRFFSQNQDVPFEQRAEFNALLGNVHLQCLQLNENLHILYLLYHGDQTLMNRAIGICGLISAQRNYLSSVQPRYILNLEGLKNMANQLHSILEMFSNRHQAVMQKMLQQQQQQQAQQGPLQQAQPQPKPMHQPGSMPPQPGQIVQPPLQQPGTIPPNGMNGAAQSPPETTPGTRAAMLHPSPQQQPPTLHQQPPPQHQAMSIPPQPNGLPIQQQPTASPSLAVQPNRSTPIHLQPPPHKRKAPNALTPSNAAPSPAAATSAPTPSATANAPTPTAIGASPAAPNKSPKGKAAAKPPKPAAKRKFSKSAPTPVPAISAVASASNASAPSSNASASTQVAEQLQTLASTNGSMKRPREEDVPVVTGIAPSPAADQPSPPKRAKTEWEGPPSEELKQKKAMVESVNTTDDACDFLEQMTEFFKIAQNGQPQELDGFSDTLNLIFKGCAPVPGNPDDLNSLSFGPSGITPLSPPTIPKEEFEKYIDFTCGGTHDGEDDDSKTPELISSSSTTNPSPGSNSGNESNIEGVAAAGVETKTEKSLDPTRLGLWKEIDGGESDFFQTSEWKWDGSMPTTDQSWAIFTSST